MKNLLRLLLLLPLLLGSYIEARYLSEIPEICHKPPPRSEGICTIEIEGYYYDPAALDCVSYTLPACRVSPGQSFGSQKDCVATCIIGQRRSPEYYRNE